MTPQDQTARCKSAIATLLLLFAFFFALASAVPEAEAQPEVRLVPETIISRADDASLNSTLDDISSLYMSADADCTGNEGQWNCLSDRFQRCTSGAWTAAVACDGTTGNVKRDDSAVTLCTPLGRTDVVDFQGECNAAWGYGGGDGWGGGGGGGGGDGVRCNGNGCYFGKGSNLTVEKWVYVIVVGVVLLGFF